ncbi:MAG: hypothetical protein PHV28_12205 [Kiritimatiellae bacterium]|nr:hypothetical protein [Kiritimatiellia bacterium]
MTKRLKSRSAYDSDGRALPPGGDISGDPAAWPLLSWSRHTYDGTRPSLTLHSDGTSESNVWDCCRLTSSTARDGAVTEHDAFPADGLAFSREVSLAALPGAAGRYPAAETFSDGLGRVTNTLRTVWFNGARVQESGSYMYFVHSDSSLSL